MTVQYVVFLFYVRRLYRERTQARDMHSGALCTNLTPAVESGSTYLVRTYVRTIHLILAYRTLYSTIHTTEEQHLCFMICRIAAPNTFLSSLRHYPAVSHHVGTPGHHQQCA